MEVANTTQSEVSTDALEVSKKDQIDLFDDLYTKVYEFMELKAAIPNLIKLIYEALRCSPDIEGNKIAEEGWKKIIETFGDLLSQIQNYSINISDFCEKFEYAEESVKQFIELVKGNTSEEIETKVNLALPQLLKIQKGIINMLSRFDTIIKFNGDNCKEYFKDLIPAVSQETYVSIDENLKLAQAKLQELINEYERLLDPEEVRTQIISYAEYDGKLKKLMIQEQLYDKDIKMMEEEVKNIEKNINEIKNAITQNDSNTDALIQAECNRIKQEKEKLENEKREEFQRLTQDKSKLINSANEQIKQKTGELSQSIEVRQITDYEKNDRSWWWWWGGNHSRTTTRIEKIDKSSVIMQGIESARKTIKDAEQNFSQTQDNLYKIYQQRIDTLNQDFKTMTDIARNSNKEKLTGLTNRINELNSRKDKISGSLKLTKENLAETKGQINQTSILRSDKEEALNKARENVQKKLNDVKKEIEEKSKKIEEIEKQKDDLLGRLGAKNTIHAIKLSNAILEVNMEVQFHMQRIGSFKVFVEGFLNKIEDQTKKISDSKAICVELKDEDISMDEVSEWAQKFLKLKKYEEAKDMISMMVCGDTVREILENPSLLSDYGINPDDKPFQLLWKSKWKPRIEKLKAEKRLEIINQATKSMLEIFNAPNTGSKIKSIGNLAQDKPNEITEK